MNLDDLLARVDGLIVALEDGLRKEVETIGTDAAALVITRVSETGLDANGAKFKPYTPEYERYKRFASSASRKEGAKKKAARKTAPASKEKPVGRYRGFVDFTLTGQMLSSIGLQETKAENGGIKVIVGGRDVETRKKMEGNDNNRLGWFSLSVSEQETLADQSQVRINKFIERFLTA